MSKIKMFEDFIPVGYGTSLPSTYLGVQNINTGYNMTGIVGPAMNIGNAIAQEAYSYESNDNPDHNAKDYIKEAKKHICNVIDECYEQYHATKGVTESIKEADDYEFDPKETAARLKKREQQNIQRYKAAQKRGDNYAIALYELKMKLDKIDFEKLKVTSAIKDLMDKNNK